MKNRKKALFVFCAALLAVAVVWAVGADFRSGTVVMRIEGGGSKSWSMSFARASDGFTSTHTMRLDEGEDLRADVTLEKGEALLIIRQKEKEISVPLDTAIHANVISLEGFDKGRVQLRLISYGAEDLKGDFRLIERE